MWIAIAAVGGIMVGCAVLVWLDSRDIRIEPRAPKAQRKRASHEP